jgi:hypothetical protein
MNRALPVAAVIAIKLAVTAYLNLVKFVFGTKIALWHAIWLMRRCDDILGASDGE